MRLALVALLLSFLVAGNTCATTSTQGPGILTKVITPSIPASDLECAPEPFVPAVVTTDVDLTQYFGPVRDAGAECRSKLAGVKKALTGK